MAKRSPQFVLSSVEEAFASFESGSFDNGSSLDDLIAIASASYEKAYLPQQKACLTELYSRMHNPNWYIEGNWIRYYRSLSSVSIIGKLDFESTSQLVVEIQQAPSIPLDVNNLVDSYHQSLHKKLENKSLLPWNALNITYSNVFNDAKERSEKEAIQQIISIIEAKSPSDWPIYNIDKVLLEQHLTAIQNYSEWLQHKLKPRNFKRGRN